ncbi:4-hydroxy-tetrahydrodipicolinate reductase [hydrothermal vent metagenome]|uniref:4-hydroxy-tetrahydrodipicolinate reductase n=1 Tax=hydrothermal vent metagenome TaxID=652676 RepID=A0A1W1BFZ6_9ZZZZ
MIKIAVVGSTGKMGKTIIEVIEKNDNITLGVALDKGDDLNLFLDKFDVLIDFTRPEASLTYLEICAKNNKKIVIGTTGFNEDELKKIEYFSTKIPVVFAPNMSVGVNLTLKLLEMSAKVIGEDSDIEVVEAHHRYKVDSPSGTALKMGEVVANALGRDLKQCGVYTRQGVEEPRDKNTIGFSTIRGGDVVGEHTVSFFMDGERVEITHKASSRKIFALGAVRASIWLNNQKNGLYSMTDVLELGDK